MKKRSENTLEEILDLKEENNYSLFDATLDYCEINEIDPLDLIESLDDYTKELLKQDIINQKLIPKKLLPTTINRHKF